MLPKVTFLSIYSYSCEAKQVGFYFWVHFFAPAMVGEEQDGT